jgi:hypothetical protein
MQGTGKDLTSGLKFKMAVFSYSVLMKWILTSLKHGCFVFHGAYCEWKLCLTVTPTAVREFLFHLRCLLLSMPSISSAARNTGPRRPHVSAIMANYASNNTGLVPTAQRGVWGLGGKGPHIHWARQQNETGDLKHSGHTCMLWTILVQRSAFSVVTDHEAAGYVQIGLHDTDSRLRRVLICYRLGGNSSILGRGVSLPICPEAPWRPFVGWSYLVVTVKSIGSSTVINKIPWFGISWRNHDPQPFCFILGI